MSPAEREAITTIRLSKDERNMLKALAAIAGDTQSHVIRALIRREHAEHFGTKEKPKTKR